MENNKKTALLAVSFGTSFNESRALTIDAVENALALAYPRFELRRAFSSKMIINKILRRDGIKTDTVEEALSRLRSEGFQNVLIQPTHIMPGTEYNSVLESAESFKDCFESLKIAEPLLSSAQDYEKLISAITADCPNCGKNEAVIWMGHGTEHRANRGYERLQNMLLERGYKRHIVATVEAEPGISEAAELAKKLGAEKLILRPLMIVAGDHANNDMAGDEEESWKKILEAEGFSVSCLLKGLGELEAVQQIFVEHTAQII